MLSSRVRTRQGPNRASNRSWSSSTQVDAGVMPNARPTNRNAVSNSKGKRIGGFVPSTFAGQTVFFDRSLTIRYLPPGTKRVRVTKSGYRTEERVVAVDDGGAAARLRIALRELPGSRTSR